MRTSRNSGWPSGVSDHQVVGCGALHVMWEDLAEIRTVAVDASCQGHGIGHRLVEALLDSAREVGVARVFVLTFALGFFARHGFEEIEGTPVSHEVYAELLRSYDEGVAEFLDLGRVKPNTLGNSRMLLHLPPLPEAPHPGAPPPGTPLSDAPLPGAPPVARLEQPAESSVSGQSSRIRAAGSEQPELAVGGTAGPRRRGPLQQARVDRGQER